VAIAGVPLAGVVVVEGVMVPDGPVPEGAVASLALPGTPACGASCECTRIAILSSLHR
jgi:hypothetical protein